MPSQIRPAPTTSVTAATIGVATGQEKPSATRPVTATCSNSTIVAMSSSAPPPINAADSAVKVSFSEISARNSCSSVCTNVAISVMASPARSTTPFSLARAGGRRPSASSDLERAAIVPSEAESCPPPLQRQLRVVVPEYSKPTPHIMEMLAPLAGSPSQRVPSNADSNENDLMRTLKRLFGGANP